MTETEYKLIEGQISGLQALFQANFDVLNEQMKENKTDHSTLIEHQKITNGRINNVESVHKKHSAQIIGILKIQRLQNDKGIKFLLWFSEKKYRLLIAALPFYLFTIKEVRDLFINLFLNIFT